MGMCWVWGSDGAVVMMVLFSILLAPHTHASQTPRAATLTKEDLYFLFGDQEVASKSIVNIRSKSRERRATPSLTVDPGYLDVTVEDRGQELEFELRPNFDLVSPKFVFVVDGKEGVKEYRDLGRPSCLYYGTAKNKPNTLAALSSCDGRGFTGVIVSGNESHLIRPFNRTRRKRQAGATDEITTDGLHVINDRRRDAKCGVHDIKAMTAPRHIIELGSNSRSKRAITSATRQIETGVFVDDDLYKLMKEGETANQELEKLNDVVLTIMNGVNLLYNAPSLDLHFTITLVRIHVIEDASKGPSKEEGDIQRYLTSFCQWQRKLNRQLGAKEKDTWDHALMLSGLDLYDGIPENDEVIGLAWVAGMCHPSYSCTINEGTSFEAVYVIAHEMGHNLGMTHDGQDGGNRCDGGKYLMSASTGPGKVTWSTCSNRELKKFIDEYGMACLSNKDRGPRYLEFDLTILPGAKFGQEAQCTFAEGDNFKPYVISKSPYNHCISGQCVEKESLSAPSPTPRPTIRTTTTPAPRDRGGTGLSGILRRIRDLFRKYLFMRRDAAEVLLTPRWRVTPASPCSAECGGGWQEGRVTCVGMEGDEALSDNFCDTTSRPPGKTSCNTSPCTISLAQAAHHALSLTAG